MSISHVLAVVSVSDIDAANAWYQKLFGMPATNNPMPTLVEWQIVDHGWVQVHHDPERAGTALLNFAVDDLEAHLAGLAERGLSTPEIDTANKGVRLSTVNDPDGNTITFIGSFRPNY